jgi:hypothetical protein
VASSSELLRSVLQSLRCAASCEDPFPPLTVSLLAFISYTNAKLGFIYSRYKLPELLGSPNKHPEFDPLGVVFSRIY